MQECYKTSKRLSKIHENFLGIFTKNFGHVKVQIARGSVEIARKVSKSRNLQQTGPSPCIWMDLDHPRASEALD
jgi:hypothetical protein